MYDLLSIFAGFVIGIGFLVLVARFLERRAETDGPLFTKPPSLAGRLVAGSLALLFGGAALAELFLEGSIHVILPLLSFGLILYAFGAHTLLASLQNETNRSRQDRDAFRKD